MRARTRKALVMSDPIVSTNYYQDPFAISKDNAKVPPGALLARVDETIRGGQDP
jgi:hypothetical protein